MFFSPKPKPSTQDSFHRWSQMLTPNLRCLTWELRCFFVFFFCFFFKNIIKVTEKVSFQVTSSLDQNSFLLQVLSAVDYMRILKLYPRLHRWHEQIRFFARLFAQIFVTCWVVFLNLQRICGVFFFFVFFSEPHHCVSTRFSISRPMYDWVVGSGSMRSWSRPLKKGRWTWPTWLTRQAENEVIFVGVLTDFSADES